MKIDPKEVCISLAPRNELKNLVPQNMRSSIASSIEIYLHYANVAGAGSNPDSMLKRF